jgi:BASS family bile acid:Na+ symporter
MPISGPISETLLTIVAAATIFTVMFDLGLGIVAGDFRWVWRHSGLVARGLFAVLIAVPALAVAVTEAFGLSRAARIGIVLMAISPGAPVALRRSLGAGGHRSFAPALQILLALLAVVSMPLWIAALNEFYAGHASIAPGHVARQVFVAQLLPLGLGMLVRHFLPRHATRVEPAIARIGTILLVALAVLAIVNVAEVVVEAGPRVALAIVVVTLLAVAVGHALGAPDDATRTAVAISSAARNPGLALLVATLNNAVPEITRTVLAYLLVSALTLLPYVIWCRRRARASSAAMPSTAKETPAGDT